MRRADEREIDIAKKSATSGFAMASVLLTAFLLYGLISGDHSSRLLIILGATQAVYWTPEYTMEK
ncbi:MAG: DUF6442 family protein [Archaeoglobaceae archaeon]